MAKAVGSTRVKGFHYQGGELYCERVPLARLADEVGTPAYVYSGDQLVDHYRQFDRALGSYPHWICYSVKANGNLVLLRLLARAGAAFDIVSGGELHRVLAAGGSAGKVVFSGVGKTAEEMDYALREGIAVFNCESAEELRLLSERASRLKRTARAALRVNPHVVAPTHPHIATGLREHKFGIEIGVAERLYAEAQGWQGLALEGLSCHIGSQIFDLRPIEQAVKKVVELAGRLRKRGFVVRHLDAGGGLGVAYRPEERPPSIAEYGRRIVACVKGSGLQLRVEPGRALVAETGILLTRVVRSKMTGSKRFVIVDAAMNDLIRPSLYGAHHEIRPLRRMRPSPRLADIVGPVCETGDFFARDRALPAVEPDDLLAIFTAGAYGMVLSSNYNARPRPAEIVVRGSRWSMARERESYGDLLRGEL
jgi:diaminopimelate decarboxylase